MKKQKRKIVLYIIIWLIIFLLIIAGIFLFAYFKVKNSPKTDNTKQSVSSQQTTSPPAKVVYGVASEQDYKNFKDILAKNNMIQDLPDNAKILLSFYNFYTGERVWEKSYTLTKGEVKEGSTEDYDIKLIMHSKYLTVLNENNFCSTITSAKGNGDFASETSSSTISLLWKFKSMMKYKSCLGL
jgi:hypothetical protein